MSSLTASHFSGTWAGISSTDKWVRLTTSICGLHTDIVPVQGQRPTPVWQGRHFSSHDPDIPSHGLETYPLSWMYMVSCIQMKCRKLSREALLASISVRRYLLYVITMALSVSRTSYCLLAELSLRFFTILRSRRLPHTALYPISFFKLLHLNSPFHHDASMPILQG